MSNTFAIEYLGNR